MEIMAVTSPGATAPAGPQAAPPQHVADLRPAADAAALTRNPTSATAAAAALPVVPVSPVLPATASQAAEVSRSLIAGASSDTDASAAHVANPVTPSERVLKPWGVAMLPAAFKDESGRQRHENKDDST